MLRWRRHLSDLLRDPQVEAAFLARIRAHDSNPQAWVVMDAFQKFFSHKNSGSESNFFIFRDKSIIKISRDGIHWSAEEPVSLELREDCEYSTWYIAQRIGIERWSRTFLGPFPLD
jgi:hypothetical protein